MSEPGLLTDEHVPGPCIAVLRSVGYDVLRAKDEFEEGTEDGVASSSLARPTVSYSPVTSGSPSLTGSGSPHIPASCTPTRRCSSGALRMPLPLSTGS
jgi:hypothetical protein